MLLPQDQTMNMPDLLHLGKSLPEQHQHALFFFEIISDHTVKNRVLSMRCC